MRVLRAVVCATLALAAGACGRHGVVYMQPPPVYAQPQPYPQQAYPQVYQPAPQVYAAVPAASPYDPYGAMAAQSYPQAGYQQVAYPGYGEPAYTLDAGDRVRIVVYGQEGLNNSYIVDPNGLITLPLAGAIPARGLSKDQLAAAITEKLKQGYIREPHVAVDIETYRPFFILGEVNNPGQYPYVANMSVETAVAIAGGYTARADRRKITVTRSVNGQSYKGALPSNSGIRPGDTVEIAERWF